MRKLLCVIGFAILCPGNALSQPPAPAVRADPPQGVASTPNKPAPPGQLGTKDAPFFVEGLVTTKPSETETSREAREAKEKAANENLTIQVNGATALFTGLMFIVAFVQAGFFLQQLRYMRESLKDTNLAANAAQAGADAAKDGVALARDTARRQLRAYIHVASIQGIFEANEGYTWAHVELKNYGQTPAYEVTGWIAIQLKTDHYQPTFPDGDLEQAVSIIPPGNITVFRVPSSEKVPEALKQAIIKSKATAFVHGRVSYKDIFGDVHYTRYRLFMRGDGAADGLFMPSTTGNETDDSSPQPEPPSVHTV